MHPGINTDCVSYTFAKSLWSADMDEKQSQGTAHKVNIQGRHSGTISGVSDVLSFDC